MAIKAVLGCLFGDEAKAKIVDALANDFQVIIRFQGGSNAGHTVIINGVKNVMHLIPSGIFYPNNICVLASGVVVDPVQLECEMQTLADQSINLAGRFFIDERTSVVLPIHKQLDKNYETLQGVNSIGTTLRGIGPCYADSISRIGLRMTDLKNTAIIKEKLGFIYKFHHIKITKDDLTQQTEQLATFYQRLAPHFVNLPYLIEDWVAEGKSILFEGAQGTLLDIYFGTYPFVTSSHTCAGGIAASAGLSPKKVEEYIGVMKAYFTRVGAGPFPTELKDETGDYIRQKGNEYGATTGRPRRCGWFDAAAAKYSVMINGIDCIALTLLDVLSGLKTLKICIGYYLNKEYIESFPADALQLEKCVPQYLEMPGWEEDISNCKTWAELPKNAQDYVRMIQTLTGVTVRIISVGPERSQTIYIDTLI